MAERTKNKEERIEIRLSAEEKRYFVRAQKLSGEKTFSAFITRSLRSRSEEIIREKEVIIASEIDAEIFFDSITNPKEPSTTLKKASDDYQTFLSNLRDSNG